MKTTMKTTLGKSSLGKMGMILGGVVILSGTIAEADTFGSGSFVFSLDFVGVGNAGNANDSGAGGGSYSSPYGGVPYDYRVGVNEISQNVINAAVAGGLTGMPAGSWTGDKSSAGINWFQAAGFVNWLNTSTGHQAAYQLNPGLTAVLPWSSADAWQEGGENVYRNKNAHYFIPNQDEWYKAAFHQNDGVTDNYWDFAIGSNSAPTGVASGTSAGTAVYKGVQQQAASVFSAGGLSAYGTMGQGGNVSEWLDNPYDGPNPNSADLRWIMGGSYNNFETQLQSSYMNNNLPTFAGPTVGFRVASVPEPSAVFLMIGAGVLALARRRTRVAL